MAAVTAGGSSTSATYSGSAEAEDDVGAVEDELLLAAGDAHHVDDDPQGQQGRDLGHEVALALLDDLVDDAGGHAFDVGTHRLELSGREAPGHDAAQPGVAGVVHVDHRAEELEELLRQVGDVGALARAEQLGLPAGLDDVGVAGDRPVGRLGDAQVRQASSFIGARGRSARSAANARLALVQGPGPPLQVRQVDRIDVGGRCAHAEL